MAMFEYSTQHEIGFRGERLFHLCTFQKTLFISDHSSYGCTLRACGQFCVMRAEAPPGEYEVAHKLYFNGTGVCGEIAFFCGVTYNVLWSDIQCFVE